VAGSLDHGRSPDQSVGSLPPPAKSTDGKREAGLQDGRHGHPAKLREPVQQWLKDYCQAAPGTPSHIVQQALENRFGVEVCISHLNATRAALGLGSRATPLREKNRRRTQASNHSG
jgi:transposase